MSKIVAIGTAVPEYGTKQSSILEFMQAAYHDDSASRKLKVLFNYSGINNRNSVVSDFGNKSLKKTLFDQNKEAPSVEKRLSIFKTEAVSLAIIAIKNLFEKINATVQVTEITHLITVTCTGLYAPGIDSALIERLDLPVDIFHTSINFLGCNAAFHALKIGDLIVKTDKNAKVLIVCVELCTLHFQPKNNHDNLLANTIFGDGAAAVLLAADTFTSDNQPEGLFIHGFYSLLLNDGKDLMSWNITPINFEMSLDAKIPEFIGEEIHNILEKAGQKLNIKPKEIGKWAIHPGGKKILDTIKKQLKLTASDMQPSYKVLDEYGNMSSPTILFVLNELLQSKHKISETIFSIGFGPGLSIETAVFKYAH
jgi:predicted naringenin-chalcone synthase